MNRDEKAAVVEEIAGQIKASEAVFAVDYRGLTVPQAAELRSKLRDSDATFRVVKNSLTELAADQAGAESLKEFLVGPTALTIVRGDAALAAKTLSDTSRLLRGLLEFKGGLMSGSHLTAQDVTSIARLPSREVLQGQLVGMVASPLVGLVRGLNGLLAGVAIQLAQVLEQRGGAPVESAGADSIASSVEAADGGGDAGAELAGAGEPAEAVAVAEPEPEVAAEAEAAAEPEAAAESEAEAATEPEPAAAAEPEPAAEPDPTTTEEPDQDAASEDASDA
ncbi:MAG TPA: 50S ribosomal protein L10 [Solirubrobacteraceae bacterium]